MNTKFTNLDGLKKSERKGQTEKYLMRLQLVVVTMVIFPYGYIGCFSCVSCWSTISIFHFNSLICWYLIKWFRNKGFMKTINIHVIIIHCEKKNYEFYELFPLWNIILAARLVTFISALKAITSTLLFK